MKTAVLPKLLDETCIGCTCAAHSKVLSSATESLPHIDKTNKQRSFTAALRPAFFSVPLSTEKGNKQGTQQHTSLCCHWVWGGGRQSQEEQSIITPPHPHPSLFSPFKQSCYCRQQRGLEQYPYSSQSEQRLDNLPCGHTQALAYKAQKFLAHVEVTLPCGTWTDICSS